MSAGGFSLLGSETGPAVHAAVTLANQDGLERSSLAGLGKIAPSEQASQAISSCGLTKSQF